MVLKSRLRLTAFGFPPVDTVKIPNHVAAMWGSEPKLAVDLLLFIFTKTAAVAKLGNLLQA